MNFRFFDFLWRRINPLTEIFKNKIAPLKFFDRIWSRTFVRQIENEIRFQKFCDKKWKKQKDVIFCDFGMF